MKIHFDEESQKGREYISRRAEILKAAEKLFAERGFHGTTMLDLANLSEFSMGTLYNFFKTKEEVYYTLLMEKLDFFQLRLNRDVNQHPAGLAQILALIETTVKFFQENQSFFRIFIQERSGFELSVGAAAGEELREKHLTYIDFVAHVMNKAIKKGDIQEFNPLEVAYSLVGILNSLLVYWTMYTKPNELGSKVPFIYDLFLKGVAKRKGEK